eukprot:TRINITY_DN2451_c0_g1_i8.p1 TRINITY_DN2451_c0_g1~~TRINITY_DN2451_c0_g1_i8.p1  ORF type:complete len:105 (-),score=9.50 TRINITY_DN2451_c0_g1_i8:234-548(-)
MIARRPNVTPSLLLISKLISNSLTLGRFLTHNKASVLYSATKSEIESERECPCIGKSHHIFTEIESSENRDFKQRMPGTKRICCSRSLTNPFLVIVKEEKWFST